MLNIVATEATCSIISIRVIYYRTQGYNKNFEDHVLVTRPFNQPN